MLPSARRDQDRDHAQAFLGAAPQQGRHLLPSHELRAEKRRGNEQDRRGRLFHGPLDLREPIITGCDPIIHPDIEHAQGL